uniref:Uncharacterized protein n=1 Tax=Chromera velia CCMP2878 TaxID=1169474 RepID=A0A0G4FBK4_9ALVE|eukprot:Cvel_16190.t1-p1 / transcript=Cvel_16190.t1 / gene=Cvel_16190 / organism=Chromera_velia_CCMP2878 / gene_product=hypothetical protein / transcript_product=hypothetical protein / location=Cvel_scaffold1235:47411-49103(-) / protein_length=445 / sequence_SO=supercontig / SO=protein_coding / is_pseudo=false
MCKAAGRQKVPQDCATTVQQKDARGPKFLKKVHRTFWEFEEDHKTEKEKETKCTSTGCPELESQKGRQTRNRSVPPIPVSFTQEFHPALLAGPNFPPFKERDVTGKNKIEQIGSCPDFENQTEQTGTETETAPSTFLHSCRSIGSIGHHPLNCSERRCYWFYSNKGCKNGWKCDHCHHCPPPQKEIAFEKWLKTEKQKRKENIQKNRNNTNRAQVSKDTHRNLRPTFSPRPFPPSQKLPEMIPQSPVQNEDEHRWKRAWQSCTSQQGPFSKNHRRPQQQEEEKENRDFDFRVSGPPPQKQTKKSDVGFDLRLLGEGEGDRAGGIGIGGPLAASVRQYLSGGVCVGGGDCDRQESHWSACRRRRCGDQHMGAPPRGVRGRGHQHRPCLDVALDSFGGKGGDGRGWGGTGAASGSPLSGSSTTVPGSPSSSLSCEGGEVEGLRRPRV